MQNKDNDNTEEKQIEIPNSIIYEHMKKKHKESFSEKQKQQEEEFIKNLGDNQKYIKQLEGTPYSFSSKGFIYIKPKEAANEGIEYIKISNVLVIPVKKYDYKTEEETKSYIEIKAIITPTGEVLPNIIVPIKQIESGTWFINSEWGLKVRFELPPQKSIQIDCFKELSEYMETETIYQYTGFTEIKGKKVFLHTGGAVGTDESVKVELGDENLNKFTLTDKEFDIKNTLGYTLHCLKVAPIKVVLPILSLVFMTPLTSIFEEVGVHIGFLTWVQGPQQCKKTSMVCAFCSHFGFFDKNHTPMSFLDGIPSSREKSAKCKDVLILCDDYFPSSNKQEASDMRKFAEQLITGSSEKMTGTRSKSNGEMRKTYRMKGQVIATRRNVSRYKSKPYVKGIIY